MAAQAQNGAEIYKAHCASCHDSGVARAPSESALRAINLIQVLGSLQTGVMKTVGDTLTPQERYAVALYLSVRSPQRAERSCSELTASLDAVVQLDVWVQGQTFRGR
ncbi:MAG: c-type cytochrome [Terriglobia bacterium]